MAQCDYIRFLVATGDDPALQTALRRASGGLRTLADLVAFGERHGYRFAEEDIPLKVAGTARSPRCGARPTTHSGRLAG